MTDRFVIMGVAGCGKTSVGEALAARTGWTFLDGDSLHPQPNIEKMASGVPLTDEDRYPWLMEVGDRLRTHEGPLVVGCSALKRSYRDLIRAAAGGDVCFIFLDGTRDLIERRMRQRTGHFMPLALLDSQFAALERPDACEAAITVEIDGPLASIVEDIIDKLEVRAS